MYTDGGCDGNGAKEIWEKAGYGVVIYACVEDGTLAEAANLFGPVVVDATSEWFIGTVCGTNQTCEMCGVVTAVL